MSSFLNQLLDKKRGKFAISTSTPLVTAKKSRKFQCNDSAIELTNQAPELKAKDENENRVEVGNKQMQSEDSGILDQKRSEVLKIKRLVRNSDYEEEETDSSNTSYESDEWKMDSDEEKIIEFDKNIRQTRRKENKNSKHTKLKDDALNHLIVK